MSNQIENKSNPIIINVEAAAALSGLSKGIVRSLVGIPGTGVMMAGRCVKVHRATFEKYLSSLTEKSGACIGDCTSCIGCGAMGKEKAV